VRKPLILNGEMLERSVRHAWKACYSLGRVTLRVIQRNTMTGANLSARLGHPMQKLRMMFEPIFEPVLVRAESDQDAGRPSVTSDQDFLVFGQAQVLGEVILDRCQSDLARGPLRWCLLRRARPGRPPS
jgi:hypothetical protein